ncbi:hypothetical protein DICSQDRAFT_140618 [Dichomitus squalens LYAD-421 SS1]|uniref:Uncharacterized protein n=1 Tax=Dichomitus squalens (strain LYAD-421) TaxID=732165 RepID=R7SQF3_DICSQ|nr:uncharacterized protein DICSQDRAFT_140618 [Dichomitus squalens LYAD-421 SS1]EJF57167.1 hypothetical protein DICSQDRAFT_140618 [Dichomitus squalens LYAD-421 SS1]
MDSSTIAGTPSTGNSGVGVSSAKDPVKQVIARGDGGSSGAATAPSASSQRSEEAPGEHFPVLSVTPSSEAPTTQSQTADAFSILPGVVLKPGPSPAKVDDAAASTESSATALQALETKSAVLSAAPVSASDSPAKLDIPSELPVSTPSVAGTPNPAPDTAKPTSPILPDKSTSSEVSVTTTSESAAAAKESTIGTPPVVAEDRSTKDLERAGKDGEDSAHVEVTEAPQDPEPEQTKDDEVEPRSDKEDIPGAFPVTPAVKDTPLPASPKPKVSKKKATKLARLASKKAAERAGGDSTPTGNGAQTPISSRPPTPTLERTSSTTGNGSNTSLTPIEKKLSSDPLSAILDVPPPLPAKPSVATQPSEDDPWALD